MSGKRMTLTGSEALVAEYIRWLIGLFEQTVGDAVGDPDLFSKSVAIVIIDRRRSAADEDFLALFATEMAERIKANATGAGEASASDRFLRLLSTTCDTVRHRIVRAARRRSLACEQSAFIEQVPAAIQEQPVASELIQKLMQSLDLDEHLLVSHYLDGEALETIAASLGWSRRTAYRRLDAVIKKLRRFGANDIDHN